MDYEEDCSMFQLPVNAAPATVFDAPKAPASSVVEASKVVPSQTPAQLTSSYAQTESLSDQAIFTELDAISEEVIACRNQILSKIC